MHILVVDHKFARFTQTAERKMDFSMTCREIGTRVGLSDPDTVLNRVCEEDLLPHLAGYFHLWREVGPFLGLGEVDVYDIERDYDSEPERRVGAIRRWKAGNGHRATYGELIKGLLAIGRVDYAENICSLLRLRGE